MAFWERLLTSRILAKFRIDAAYYGLRNERFANVFRCMEYLDWLAIRGKKGDFWEFGVAHGQFITNAYHISRHYQNLSDMLFFGFDSFEGLPDIKHEKDRDSGWDKRYFYFNIKSVKQELKKSRVPTNKITLIPGFYDKSLNEQTAIENNLTKVSYVHIDCDLYASTKPVLDFIKPFLIQGAIIDFDDYFCYESSELGEPKAFQEWLESNPDIKVRPFSRYSVFCQAFTISLIEQ